ncbi:hypothetical protein AVEN_1547-1, partial [Araneus ventricosus]
GSERQLSGISNLWLPGPQTSGLCARIAR